MSDDQDLGLEEIREEEPEKTSLFFKVGQVMREVGALEPDKHHDQQNYGYISADKILSRLGTAMVRHGVTIIPSVLSYSVEQVEYKTGRNLFHANLRMRMTIADVDGNEHAVSWSGAGVDYSSPDKAYYKAVTSGHKYFVMKLFMVGVGNEDGEHQSVPDSFMGGPLISVKTMEEISNTAEKVWGENWKEEHEEKLAKHVTSGSVASISDLTQSDAEKLLLVVKKRLEDS